MLKEEIKKISKYPILLFLLLIIVLDAMVLVFSCFPDADTYFIISTGEYIVKNKIIPTTNPFVIHDELRTIVQQWLFDVIIYKIYSVTGWIGIYLYSLLIVIILMILMYILLSFYSQNTRAKMISVLLYGGFVSTWVVARPTSISLILFSLMIIIIKQYQKNRKSKLLLLLPLISLLMINVHAALWPIMFVLLLPFIFPTEFPTNFKLKEVTSFIRKWLLDQKQILLLIVSMILIALLNPNGINGIMYIFLSYNSATSNNAISELQASPIISKPGMFVIGTILCLYWYVNKFKKNIDMSIIYMSFGTMLLAALHMRNAWFLSFSLFPIFVILIDKIYIEKNEDQNNKKMKIKNKILLSTSALFILIFVCAIGSIAKVKDKMSSPVKAVEYLESTKSNDIVLFTGFNNGSYMEFNGYKVYIDARPELFQKKINKKEDIYSEYLSLLAGKLDYKEFLDKYEFTHLIIDDGMGLEGYLQCSEDYEKVVIGNGYSLYEKK